MTDVQARLADINARFEAWTIAKARYDIAHASAIALIAALAVFGLCALAEEPLRQQDLINQEQVHHG